MSIKNTKRAIYMPLIIALVFIGGYYLGVKLTPGHRNNDNVFFIQNNKYDKVNDIINYIEQDYVDSVSRDELVEDAISGILDQLDPHSSYISSDHFHEVNDPLLGNFEGIGIQFRIEKDTITVIRAIQGGPSEKVGLKAGDRIVMIDDSLVAGVGVENIDAIKMLKGKRGTKVKVSVSRREVDELVDFTITRDVIPTYSVDVAYMVDDSTGYIMISKFAATTYEEFVKASERLSEAGMKQLILDLRGNTGGYLKAAIKLADEFLPEKSLIVYTEGKNRPNYYEYATKKGQLEGHRLTILIDEGSASASEIVAGAIQDNDRGLIVGRRSFGKALVQEQLNFPDGSGLRLTVARYYTPTGRNIQRPYDNGSEEYYEDFHKRITNGELENADSIHFDDSLKYYTPGGRVVYGGGGIMPDVFVSLKMDEKDVYYNKLLKKNLIFQFAFDYTDNNRDALEQYNSTENFFSDFHVSDEMFNELIEKAKESGIKGTRKEVRDSEFKIKTLLKAFIGRNLLDDAGFYPLYHKIDRGFLAGYEALNSAQDTIPQ